MKNSFLLGLALAAFATPAWAQEEPVPVEPANETSAPVVDDLFQPQDEDERGMWMVMDEAERDLRGSPAVIRDPAINDYVRGVLCRVTGEDQCAGIRLYLLRTPYFNAAMAPNGMMQVWSGLLLRMENEAQLAAVLGHEYTHFEERHSLSRMRTVKSTVNNAAFNILSGGGLPGSRSPGGALARFSREQERKADAGAIRHLANAGYDTSEAAAIWELMLAEKEAVDAKEKDEETRAKGRLRRPNEPDEDEEGLWSSHPTWTERLEDLSAAAVESPGVPGENGTERYHAALAPLWAGFVEDQLKLNDFEKSDFLLTHLAERGWTPDLLYARGELYRRKGSNESIEQAAGFYTEAIEAGGELAELWRGRGLVLLKQGKDDQGKADIREYLRRAPAASDSALMSLMVGEEE